MLGLFPESIRLPWRRGADLVAIYRLASGISIPQTFRALLTLVRGKRQRAWNTLCELASRHPDYYRTWIALAEQIHAHAYIMDHGASDRTISPICLIVDCAQGMQATQETVVSLRHAFGRDVEIWLDSGSIDGCTSLTDDGQPSLGATFARASALSRSLDRVDCWVLPVRAGDTISRLAGSALTRAVHDRGGDQLIFWDEDIIVNGRRSTPWLKGAWDELLFISRDSLSGACLLPADCIALLPDEVASLPLNALTLSELLLAAIANGSLTSPQHIPLILTHRNSDCGYSSPSERAGLVRRYWHNRRSVSVEERSQPYLRVVPASPLTWPPVSIIVPTKDRADLLSACLAGLDLLAYGGFCEIILVDNGTTAADALRLLDQFRTSGRGRVVRDDGPFNFSALNNRAAAQAKGHLLCLMNNDVEATDGDWLANMVRHAIEPIAGAVGARLLYPSGTIQHAGVGIGIGSAAGHIGRGAHPDDTSHFAWHGVTRTVSAVTAACLVVRRSVYESVDGLDEATFPVAFNDIDFCLRLGKRGLQNRFIAEAQLIHHESVSRGDDYSPANRDRFTQEITHFQNRWHSVTYQDPYLSPLFSRSSEACVLQF